MNLKKIAIAPVVLGVSLLFAPNLISADTREAELVEPIKLSAEQMTRLKNLGFDDYEISTMTKEEYEQVANYDSELTIKSSHFYKVEQNNDGQVTAITEVPQEVATQAATIENKNKFSIAASNPAKPKTSWMQLELSSSKLPNKNIYLRNKFKWLKNPEIALTDVVAISHSASAVKVPGTDYLNYKYTDGKGTHTLGATHTTFSDYGVAKKFNLKAIGKNKGTSNHHGYISMSVQKGNSKDIQANAYGHYSHITLGVTGTIDIKAGSISVGKAIKVSKMPDAIIKFKY
ncbi:hypothetical protein [Niallia circulans]|uniref:hypothetical protein n=1 Tax=Niallia circulans TaxID=1397 RepID=UPI00351719B5